MSKSNTYQKNDVKNFIMGAFNGHCAINVIQIFFHLIKKLLFIHACNVNNDRNLKIKLVIKT